jgi:hypothetical protein
MKTKYDVVIQKNERGGFEIALPGQGPGYGVGNYPTPQDAYAVAKYNFENVKEYKEPAPEKAPVLKPAKPAKPHTKGKIEAAFSALNKAGRAHS